MPQKAAGFGLPGSAEGWSWGSPLSLAGFVWEMNEEVAKSILVSPLERNRWPGLCVPERTNSHCNTSQKPRKNHNMKLPRTLPDPRHAVEGLAEAPAGRCPWLSPSEMLLDHGHAGAVSLRYRSSALAQSHRSISLPAPAKRSPAQRMPCHLKSYLVLFIIWSLFFH